MSEFIIWPIAAFCAAIVLPTIITVLLNLIFCTPAWIAHTVSQVDWAYLFGWLKPKKKKPKMFRKPEHFYVRKGDRKWKRSK